MEEKEKTYWIIKDGKPVKVTAEEWLWWRYNRENTNLNEY